MYLHIGKRKTVSGKNIIGIFNIETLKLSDYNEKYLKDVKKRDKSKIIDIKANIEVRLGTGDQRRSSRRTPTRIRLSRLG